MNKKKMLTIIAIVITILLAKPTFLLVGFLLRSITPTLIVTGIFLALFLTALIFAAKIRNPWLLGAVWIVIIALFAYLPLAQPIHDHNNKNRLRAYKEFLYSVDNGAPDAEIRRLGRKASKDEVYKRDVFMIYLTNGKIDLALEMMGNNRDMFFVHLLEDLIANGSETANSQAAFLIDNGTPISNMAMISAINHNNIDGLKLLLKNGADVNPDFPKQSPLCRARRLGGREEIITILLEHGAVCED